MKLYIAYKYSHNKNKEKLKTDLEILDQLVKSWGNDTFILGRDIKKWQHMKLGYIRQMPVIYNNMSKCDAVIIYTYSPEISLGLFFELMASKILGKKTILLHQGYSASVIKKLTNKSFEINTIKDINENMIK